MLTECPECGYSLAGLPADYDCPECGLKYDAHCESYKQLRRPISVIWQTGSLLIFGMILGGAFADLIRAVGVTARPIVALLGLAFVATAFRYAFLRHQLDSRGRLVAILPDYLLLRIHSARGIRIAWSKIAAIGQPFCPLDVTISTGLGLPYLLLQGFFRSPQEAKAFMENAGARIESPDPNNRIHPVSRVLDTLRQGSVRADVSLPDDSEPRTSVRADIPTPDSALDGNVNEARTAIENPHCTVIPLRSRREPFPYWHFGPLVVFVIVFSLASSGYITVAPWLFLATGALAATIEFAFSLSTTKAAQRLIIDRSGVTITRDDAIIVTISWDYIDHANYRKFDAAFRLIDKYGQVVYRSLRAEFGRRRLMRRCANEINRACAVHQDKAGLRVGVGNPVRDGYNDPSPSQGEGQG